MGRHGHCGINYFQCKDVTVIFRYDALILRELNSHLKNMFLVVWFKQTQLANLDLLRLQMLTNPPLSFPQIPQHCIFLCRSGHHLLVLLDLLLLLFDLTDQLLKLHKLEHLKSQRASFDDGGLKPLLVWFIWGGGGRSCRVGEACRACWRFPGDQSTDLYSPSYTRNRLTQGRSSC